MFYNEEKQHWIATSFQDGQVKVFDSCFAGKLDASLELQLSQMYSPLTESCGLLVSVVPMQQQSSQTLNCGPLCIAAAYHTVLSDDVGSLTFDEERIRSHLTHCFEREELSPFPMAPTGTDVSRALQQNLLIEINCTLDDLTLLTTWWPVTVVTAGFICLASS